MTPIENARFQLAALDLAIQDLADELKTAADLIHDAEALLVQARDGALRVDLVARIEAFLARPR